jgi:hypothetical protein
VFTYDDGDLLQGISFNGNYPEPVRRIVLKSMPLRPELLEQTKGRTGILTEEAEKVTFEMFWDRYNDKARSSRVKTERVWNKMPEGERTKAYRYINRYKSSIPQGVCMKYATTYLNDQMWNN